MTSTSKLRLRNQKGGRIYAASPVERGLGLDVRPAGEFGSFQLRMLEDPTEFANRVIIATARYETKKRTSQKRDLFEE